MEKKVLAFVVHLPFSASETFFRRDIEIIERLGWKVKLFSNYSTPELKGVFNQGLVKKMGYKTCFHNSLILFRSIFIPGKIWRAYNLIEAPNKLVKLFRSLHILVHDVSHVHYGFGSASVDREWLAEGLNAKSSMSFRGRDIGIYPLRDRSIYDKLWPRVNYVHFVSESLKERAKCWTNFEEYFNGVSLVCNDIVDSNLLDEIRTLQQVEKGKVLRIITVTGTYWKKGFKNSFLVLNELQKKKVDFQLEVVGVESFSEEEFFMLKDFNLENRVKLLGKLPHLETLKKVASNDIFLSTSIQEGFGVSVLEAQGLGIIPFAYNSEGIEENIEEGVTGLISDKFDYKQLAKSILIYLVQPEEKKKEMKEKAIKRVRSQFNSDNLNKLWFSILSDK